ncbi:MAG: hypothetical protein LC643_09215, partial [Bacteroidales bacterium]|nr:hypothetical protein [Bacteroidales bacterium]
MKSEVIIVAKTKMNHASCVGGILKNGRFVRLLSKEGYNQDEDCEYEPGEFYEIEYENRPRCKAPHQEDICLSSSRYLKSLSRNGLITCINQLGKDHFWEGSTDEMFDGKLNWTHNGSGYIDEDDIPESSVGFWIPDKPLTQKEYKGKIQYAYPPIRESVRGIVISAKPGWRNISYVGFQDAVDLIPAGTLCRVSLARWWKHDDADEELEERCYLQLSGWY